MIKTTGATDGYITPAEAKRKGLTKKDGVYYKRTVLEKYRDKGWLGQVTSQYSDDDRMVAGLRLAADFYKAGYSGFNCLDYEKPRVESSPLFDPSPAVLDARDRYGKAIACLTREEVFAVRMVCCLDEEIKIPHLRDDQYKNDLELLKRYTLDGGIAGNGTTTFAKDTVLTVKTGTTTISNDVVNKGATLSLVFANGYAGGEYDLITEEGSLDKEFNIAQNALYNIKANENGSYTISKKTAGDFVASTGANVNQANTISAVAGSKTGSARFDAVAERIGGLIQSAHASDVQTALNAATALAPEVAPMVTQSESQTVNQVFGAVSTRLSGGAIAAAGEAGAEGVSSGDNVFERVAMWIQGMFNRSELDDTAKTKGFDADSAGVAMGLEKRVNDQVKLGIGYAYTNTDIDGFMRSTDVDTHTAILYGEYKPSAWFVNGVVSYGWSDYSESKNVAGYNVNADYDATSLGLQAMTGYEMQVKGFNLTPEAGLRYVHTSQDAYTDTVDQRVSANDSDILTGVIGAKADREFTLENEMTLRPEVRVALTYDMFNDAGGSVVTLANGAAYRVDGEALDRFGVELGAGLTAEVNDNVELSLRYEGQFRDDYTDHTGLLNAKYKF